MASWPPRDGSGAVSMSTVSISEHLQRCGCTTMQPQALERLAKLVLDSERLALNFAPWVKTGPTAVLFTTINSAQEVGS